MTTTDDTVLALLEESGLAADEELVGLLTDLQGLGEGPVPAPGPRLAALLVASGQGRRRLHRRGAFVGALVVLSLGTGVTAAAASPDVRDGAAGAVAAVVHVLQPHPAVPNRSAAPAPVERAQRSTPQLPTASVVPDLRSSASAGPGHDSRAENGSSNASSTRGDRRRHGEPVSPGSGNGQGSGSGASSGSAGTGSGSHSAGPQSSGSGGQGDGSGSGPHHATAPRSGSGRGSSGE